MTDLLNFYISRFKSIKRANRTGKPKAPHKPILLVTLIDWLDLTEQSENTFFIQPELILHFRVTWEKLLQEEIRDFWLPFYHLSSDGFWHLFNEKGKKVEERLQTFNQLREKVQYGKFDPALFDLLSIKKNRERLKQELVEYYFPETSSTFFTSYIPSYTQLEIDFLEEQTVAYKQVTGKKGEERQFVRKEVFKKTIPQIYQHTCAVTELRVEGYSGSYLIEACHIIPHYKTGDDRISNGIALSPNMHRAFDRGWFSVDESYKIIVANNFREQSPITKGIKEWEGKSIILPSDTQLYPSQDSLEWHRTHIFNQ